MLSFLITSSPYPSQPLVTTILISTAMSVQPLLTMIVLLYKVNLSLKPKYNQNKVNLFTLLIFFLLLFESCFGIDCQKILE
jgi:hypothetical protein